jgi:hypothetical protein
MCPFPTPPLLKNRSQYELDAARRCPFYIATRIRVKSISKLKKIVLFLSDHLCFKVWFSQIQCQYIHNQFFQPPSQVRLLMKKYISMCKQVFNIFLCFSMFRRKLNSSLFKNRIVQGAILGNKNLN